MNETPTIKGMNIYILKILQNIKILNLQFSIVVKSYQKP